MAVKVLRISDGWMFGPRQDIYTTCSKVQKDLAEEGMEEM